MSDKKEQLSKMQYFTVATKGRAKNLEDVRNGILSMDTEGAGVELEPGLIPEDWCTCMNRPIAQGCECLTTPEAGHTTRIFIKVNGQVYTFDHSTGDSNFYWTDPTCYAIDLDHKKPRLDELTNKRFYPDMAEIWCCQNSAGHRKIIGLHPEEELEEESK